MNNYLDEKKWNAYNSWNVRNLDIGELWNRKIANWIVENNLITDSTTVIDYGCSNFDLGLKLLKIAKRVDGYDPNESAINIARTRVSSTSSSNFFCARGDLPKNIYDLIIVNSVLQYFTSEDEVLEFFNYVKDNLFSSKNSVMIISDLIPTNYLATLDAINSIFVSIKNRLLYPMLIHILKSVLNKNGFSLLQIDKEKIVDIAKAANLNCYILSENLTFSKARYSVIVTKIGES